MIRSCWLLLLLMISLGSALPARAVEAVVSHNVFYQRDSARGRIAGAYLELYWQINPRSLHYQKQEAGLISSRIRTEIRFFADTGLVLADQYYLQTPALNAEQAAGQLLLDLRRYRLPYGKLSMQFKLSEDHFEGDDFVFEDSLNITVPGNAPLFSGLQILDTAYASDAISTYNRHGRIQIPLCGNFLDERRFVHYYGELYDAQRADQPLLVRRTYISRKQSGTPAAGLERRDTISATDPLQPFQGSFATTHLPSGNYYIHAELLDAFEQVISSQSTFFQLINSKPAEAPPRELDTAQGPLTYINLNKTFVAKFTLPQLQAILKMVLPAADASDAAVIRDLQRKPSELYLRSFVYNFFAKQNEAAPEKAWEAYADRVREVNKLFGSGLRPGYDTDRGYVYLKYGPPNERVPVQNESAARPYEIWQYNAVGRLNMIGLFLFYQPAHLVSDFQLLHSTVLGERRNANWRSVLYPNGNMDPENSRAIQYFGNR